MQTFDAIAIRDASPDDSENIADLIVTIQLREFDLKITYEQQPDLMEISTFYQSGKGGFWVAQAGGQIVGTVGLKDIGNNEAALRKMFVRANFRGPAHAVAAKLLTHLFNHAYQQAIKTIYLGTTDKFFAAHRFYEKKGFELIEKDALPSSFPIMAVDTRFYKFELGGFAAPAF
jgi:N-acetylglutamate synthase-like GNAT family acetyltransferase